MPQIYQEKQTNDLNLLRNAINQLTQPDTTNYQNITLYLITKIKPTRRTPSPYKIYRVSTNEDVQKHLLQVVNTHISRKNLLNGDPTISTYKFIDDDTDKVLFYPGANAPFTVAILEFLRGSNTIEDLRQLEMVAPFLFAYCLVLQNDNDNYIYTFSRVYPSHVAVARNRGLKNRIRTLFNTTDCRLEIFTHQAIDLDATVDCILINGDYYILSKSRFESLLGMEEEIDHISNDVLKTLRESELVIGMDLLENAVKTKKTLRKSIANLIHLEHYKKLNEDRIKKMEETVTKFNLKVAFDNNKLNITETTDFNHLVKILDDAYVQGLSTGEHYSSSVREKIELK